MSDQFAGSPGMPEIIGMFKEGKYQEIIPLLKDQLSKNPDDIQARACLAASYSATGNKIDAIQGFIKLTELQPNVAMHYFNLGVAYESTDNAVKAKECFEKALALNPGNEKVQQHLNAVNAKLGQPSGSVSASDNQLGSWGTTGGSAQAQGTPPPAYTQPIGNPIPPRTFGSDIPASAPEGLNWGAFFLPFFWSIGHSAWLWMVLSIFIYPVAAIVLLVKGNKIGWENRKFTGTDQFRSVQKVWAIWGVAVFAIGLVPGIIAGKTALTAYSQARSLAKMGMNAAQDPLQSMGISRADALKSTPGTGSIASVPAYTGAKQEGGTTTGSDGDGSFSATSYTASTDVDTVYQFYKNMADNSVEAGGIADLSIPTKTGLVKIHVEPKGTNQASITMKTYGQ